jgi:hypothetical protein
MKLKTGDRVLCWFLGDKFEGTLIEKNKVKLDKGTILPKIKPKNQTPKGHPWHIIHKL